MNIVEIKKLELQDKDGRVAPNLYILIQDKINELIDEVNNLTEAE